MDVVPEEYRAEALIEALEADSLAGEARPHPAGEGGARGPAGEAPRGRRRGSRPAGLRVRTFLRGQGSGSRELLEAGEVDCVTFTASSTVENFVGAFGAEEAVRLLAGSRVACIGPITAETARGHGLRVDAEAEEYTIPGLVEAVVDLFAADPARRG